MEITGVELSDSRSVFLMEAFVLLMPASRRVILQNDGAFSQRCQDGGLLSRLFVSYLRGRNENVRSSLTQPRTGSIRQLKYDQSPPQSNGSPEQQKPLKPSSYCTEAMGTQHDGLIEP